jgi:hypothetical protein
VRTGASRERGLKLAATTRPAAGGILRRNGWGWSRTMSPSSQLVLALIAMLMGVGLLNLYAGGRYVCPRCGARDADRHASDCPWHR